jgi:hypothetical protein
MEEHLDAGHVERTCEHTCGIKEMLITVGRLGLGSRSQQTNGRNSCPDSSN